MKEFFSNGDWVWITGPPIVLWYLFKVISIMDYMDWWMGPIMILLSWILVW